VAKFSPALILPSSVALNENYFSSFSKKLAIWHNNITSENNHAFLFSILWIMLPLTLFTLFRIEHSRYMLPVSAPIVMIIAQFLSQIMGSPNGFQKKLFKASFYMTLVFYFLIMTLTGAGVFLLLPILPAPKGLIILFTLGLFGPIVLVILYKLKKYFPMIIALSIIQIVILTELSGNALAYLNRYPMKLFANQILADPKRDKQIGLYQLGNHRARMGVMTGLPSIDLKNRDELNIFIKSKKNIYIVMRQSKWQESFLDLPVTKEAVDTGWEKPKMTKVKVQSLLMYGLASQLDEYSESYILLKKTDTK